MRPAVLLAWARATASLVFAAGCLVLIGWRFDLHILKSFQAGWAEMKPGTAAAFVLAAISLACTGHSAAAKRTVLGLGCALAVAAIGLLTVGDYILRWRLDPAGSPRHMAPGSAINCVLVGSALVLLHSRRSKRAVETLVLSAALTALIAVAGHLYEVKTLYTIEPYASMALHTAFSFLLLCLGIALVQPIQGLPGHLTSQGIDGVLTRRLLPAAVLIPLLLGWLGLEAQRLGLFQSEFGTALLAVAMIVALVMLLWWSAATVARIDAARQEIGMELRESAATTRALLENAAQAIIGSDLEGKIVIVNATAERLFAYTREELVHRPVESLLPEVFHPAHSVDRSSPLGIGFEMTALKKDGSHFPAEVSLSYANTNQGTLAVAFVSDISERRAAEAALRRSEARLARAQSMASLGHWEVELAPIERYWWSSEVYRIFGIDRNVQPTRNTFLASIYTEDRGKVEAAMAQTRQTGKPYQVEHRIVRPDGAVRYVREHAECVLSGAGGVAQLIGTVQDITEYWQLEQQFLQSQKLESLGRLAGGVAHDFNNLITVINGYSELSQLKLGESDPLRENLAEIQKAGLRAASLTQQLLAFSRKQVLQPTPLDLNTIVSEASSLLRRLVGEDVEFKTNLNTSLGTVLADAGQVQQVIMNLTVNARDAMPSGGWILIETRNVELDDQYGQKAPGMKPGSYVLLEVSDTGIGMDDEVKRHIFDPFYTTKPRGSGTGLGLATVYGIVKQSGGWIWVDSKPGHGTTFRIYLPRVAAEPVSVDQGAAPVQPLSGTETILIIEDQPEVRLLAARMLCSYNYTAVEAATAEEALRICERNDSIDLVLSDVVLPGMPGPELVKQIQRVRPDIGVVFMSGYTDDEVLQRGVLTAGVIYVVKPFTAADLAAKIREGLARKRN